MKIRNQEAYDADFNANSDSAYGRGILDFAKRWAELMEAKMAAGAKLEDIAGDASHTVDTEGISGFMYNCAVSHLMHCWEHGDQLRRWHNSEVLEEDEAAAANAVEGRMANSAILVIGERGDT